MADTVVEVGPGHVERAVRADKGLGELVFVASAVGRRDVEIVDAQGAVRAHQDGSTEGLAVVGRIRLIDVSGPVGGELGPGHVDPVPEGAGDVVVDGHQLLVEQGVSGPGDIIVLGHRAPGEVPGRTAGAGRAEDVERARLVGVLGHAGPAFEDLAGQVGVPASVPRHRGVATGLPVLPRRPAERGPAGEAHRDGGVLPGPARVRRVCGVTVSVTPAVVVEARHELARLHRILGDRRLVLGLTAPSQIGVGDVQAVLVDLDIGADPGRAGTRGPLAGEGRCLGLRRGP